MKKNTLERQFAFRILRAIRQDKKKEVEYYYGLYRQHYNYEGSCGDHELHKRINTHYSQYMVQKHVPEKKTYWWLLGREEEK